MLYEVALADEGVLNYPEEKIFQALYIHFGIPLEYQDLIKRTAHYNYNIKNNKQRYSPIDSGKKLSTALELFNLKESYSKEDLDKAWKKVNEHKMNFAYRKKKSNKSNSKRKIKGCGCK